MPTLSKIIITDGQDEGERHEESADEDRDCNIEVLFFVFIVAVGKHGAYIVVEGGPHLREAQADAKDHLS